MRVVSLIAAFTLREAVRRRLVVAVLALTVVYLALYFAGALLVVERFRARALEVGGSGGMPELPAATLLLFGMYVMNFLASLLSVLAAVGSVSGEIESGTILALVSKPVTRAQLVFGKWLGLAAAVSAYVTIASAALMAGSARITGFSPPDAPRAVALLVLSALVLLGLSVLGSAVMPTLANGVLMFMLYGLAWIGGLLGVVGVATDTPALATLGRVTSVVMPSDALWKGASYHLQPPQMLAVQSRGGGNPFAGVEPAGAWLVAWAVAYAAVAVVLAALALRRRDL